MLHNATWHVCGEKCRVCSLQLVRNEVMGLILRVQLLAMVAQHVYQARGFEVDAMVSRAILQKMLGSLSGSSVPQKALCRTKTVCIVR